MPMLDRKPCHRRTLLKEEPCIKQGRIIFLFMTLKIAIRGQKIANLFMKNCLHGGLVFFFLNPLLLGT